MPALDGILRPVIGAGLAWISRDSFPVVSGTVEIEGLQKPVRVIRDRWGVPHIYAQNIPDLFFAQGYVHAQDRLWQMDFNRRLASGRLAAVLGSQALPVDRWLRILRIRHTAEQEPALLDAETRTILESYAAGVNARTAQGKLPVEFFLLGYRPEPWTPADSLAWSKMLAWGLSGNWESELLRAALIEKLGPELASELELERLQPWPDRLSAILSARQALTRSEAAHLLAGPTLRDGIGSNSWVLSGERTATGKPILANDMHLPVTAPAVWYENHLSGGGFEVTGVSLPGVPLVIAGHNQHVAWGFTASFADVQDLYQERIRRDENGEVRCEFKGEWAPAEVFREEIQVRGGRSAVEEVVVTGHGPIINPLIQTLSVQEPYALRWTSLKPDCTNQALVKMCRASSCRELREAARGWASPSLNLIFADVSGEIGYQLLGRIPIRDRGDGRVPVPGWTGEYEWLRFIPYDEMPRLDNPEQGFIVTANNRIADESYPYPLGSDYVIPDRARRITELILHQEKHSLADIQAMQFDQLSHSARRVAGAIGRLQSDDPLAAEVILAMRSWDGQLGDESPEAAVHEVFMQLILPILLKNKLGDLAELYAGKGPTPLLAEGSLWGFRSWEWFQDLIETPESPWYDLGGGETREDVLLKGLEETIQHLRQSCGENLEDWKWGDLHRMTFSHILGRVKALQPFFNRGPFPAGGDGTTIWSVSTPAASPADEGAIAPPFRFIADLSDLGKSLGLLAPGQSGQPGHPHYDDQVSAWFKGGYHRMLFDPGEVQDGASASLELGPKKISSDG